VLCGFEQIEKGSISFSAEQDCYSLRDRWAMSNRVLFRFSNFNAAGDNILAKTAAFFSHSVA
jgi:hypothetical protein